MNFDLKLDRKLPDKAGRILIHTAVSNWFHFSLLSVFSTRVVLMLGLRISIIEEISIKGRTPSSGNSRFGTPPLRSWRYGQ